MNEIQETQINAGCSRIKVVARKDGEIQARDVLYREGHPKNKLDPTPARP